MLPRSKFMKLIWIYILVRKKWHIQVAPNSKEALWGCLESLLLLAHPRSEQVLSFAKCDTECFPLICLTLQEVHSVKGSSKEVWMVHQAASLDLLPDGPGSFRDLVKIPPAAFERPSQRKENQRQRGTIHCWLHRFFMGQIYKPPGTNASRSFHPPHKSSVV